MSFVSLHGVLEPVLHLVAGIVFGMISFRTLWWNTAHFARGGRVMVGVALMVARFAVLGGVLFLASLEGAMPLLTVALGILIGRSAVMRHVRRITA